MTFDGLSSIESTPFVSTSLESTSFESTSLFERTSFESTSLVIKSSILLTYSSGLTSSCLAGVSSSDFSAMSSCSVTNLFKHNLGLSVTG